MKIHDNIEIIHADCMDVMKDYKDNEFDLAVVDPPYFSGPEKKGYYKGTKQIADQGDYKDLSGSWEIPDSVYFEELIRISKNQIIWGINYFDVVLTGGRIVWIKGQQGSPFSMADIAFQSFYNRIDVFKYMWTGFWQESGQPREKKIHPTQKPVKLYDWIYINYADKGQKILDTYLGSGSSAIAAHYAELSFVGIELDKDYYKDACKRIKSQTQIRKFDL